jgi:hypothetical protein
MAISIIQIDGTSYPLGAVANNVAFDGTSAGIEAGTVQEAIAAVRLRAGDNITIENGVISATGGGSSQDSGDADTNDVINACDTILT